MAFEKITEKPSLYNDLEKKTVAEILEEINTEDHKIADAVQDILPSITEFVDKALPRIAKSGRLGVLDASEIPPTFGMPPTVIIGLIAGGDTALRNPVEKAEDDFEAGWNELLGKKISQNDAIIGIAASGTTPYVIGALQHAREKGILTGCITSNPGAPITEVCEVPMVTIVGPEYVTGSSRMKSGTAQKMVLNMISTTLMIKIGRVKGNKMVNMQLTNKKLVDRGTRMLVDELNIPYEHAQELLLRYGSAKKAIDAYNKQNK